MNNKFSKYFSRSPATSSDNDVKRKGFWLGLAVVGLPLATACVFVISYSANLANPKLSSDVKVPEPSFTAPAYTANVAAPADVDFDEPEVVYATSGSVNEIKTSSTDTAQRAYTGGTYSAVSVNEPTVTPINSAPAAVLPSGPIPAPRSSNEGVVRTGNDISDRIWADDNITTYNSFTSTEMLVGANGVLGSLSIPKIGLNVSVYETETSELDAMINGVAHFGVTSAWDGNVGFAAHNYTPTGAGDYFRDIYMLGYGDTITYTTSLGTREYAVSAISRISEDDWSSLGRSDDNLVTLITCVNDDPTQRLAVQARAR